MNAPTQAFRSRRSLVLNRFWAPARTKVAVGILLGLLLISLIAPLFLAFKPGDMDMEAFGQGPSSRHLLGTTQSGRDVFTLVVAGLRLSVMIGLVVAVLQTILAGLVGTLSAYFPKTLGPILLWFTDLLLVVPSFLLVAVMVRQFDQVQTSIVMLIILLAAFGWMISARVVRAMTLSVISLDYVQAARYLSVSAPRVITRHILPNIASYLIMDFTLGFVGAVMAESSLSFFGLGVAPPATSLGTLLGQGAEQVSSLPWGFIAPATCVVALLTCISVLGESLRDALDSHSQVGGGFA